MKIISSLLNDKIKKSCSYFISNSDPSLSVDKLYKKINSDFPQQEKRFNVVYFYSIVNQEIDYPNGKSSILYIGKTEGEMHHGKKDLGYRFKHCKEGRDSKSNLCLRYYYQKGRTLLLTIFLLEDSFSFHQVEQELRREFLKTYCAFPMADGASYKSGM